MEGIVRWFNPARGYGFIEPADGGGDVFFEVSAVEAGPRGGRELRAGDAVRFEVIDGPRGPEAAGVGRLRPPSSGPGH